MKNLYPLFLARIVLKLLLLGAFLLIPQLSNVASFASTNGFVNSFRYESVNNSFPNSVELPNSVEHINLDEFDFQKEVLLAQASANLPPVKPVIAIDYARITTPYTPISS